MSGGAAIAIAFFAAAFSYAVCRFARPLGVALQVMDIPGGRKIHLEPTPLVGGLAAAVPAILVLLFVRHGTLGIAPAMGLAGAGALLLGFLDDRVELRPLLRLGFSVLILLFAIDAAPDLRLTFLKFSFLDRTLVLTGAGGMIFTLLCFIGLQNAINMADGKNGLVSGMTLCWCLLLWIHAPADLYPVLLALTLATAVVFAFNLRGRLFLGDAGSYGLSILVGVLAVCTYNQNFVTLPAETVALWFLVPVLDTLRLVVRRLLSGHAPFKADRNHFHHLLYDAMPWSQGLAIYLGMVLVPGLIAALIPALALPLIVITASIYALAYVSLTRAHKLGDIVP